MHKDIKVDVALKYNNLDIIFNSKISSLGLKNT